jgi:hypothetical protein
MQYPGDFPSGATVSTFLGEGRIGSGMGLGTWVSIGDGGEATWYGETIEGPGVPTRSDLHITSPRNFHSGVNDAVSAGLFVTQTNLITGAIQIVALIMQPYHIHLI